ncbi:MAG: hypothetical protein ACP5I8_09915 [Phycisphaerae bacterium]
MELRDALSQIAEIRSQVALSQVFRGYRSFSAVVSGVLAIVAAAIEQRWWPHPAAYPGVYLLIWLGAATVSLMLIGVEMVWRCRRMHSEMQNRLTLLAVESFMPSLVAGGLLTGVVYTMVPSLFHLLPALWMLFFSMGAFALSRILPRATFWSGAYYLLAGIICLAVSNGGHTLYPWTMGAIFAVGQFITAGILYWTLERGHDRSSDKIP